MSSIMMTTALISSLVGQEAISEVSKSIFHSITGIFYHSNPIVRELLEEIDIYEEIDLVRTLIEEINNHTINNPDLEIDLEKFLVRESYHIIDNNDAYKEDSETDIKDKINKTAEFLSEKNMILYPNTVGVDQPFISETLTKCLYQLKDILEKIFREINDLNKGVEYHNGLWFQSFRKPTYMKHLVKIKKYQKTMESKFEYLIKLMNIYLRMDYKLFSNSESLKSSISK